jgi:hypothetical protein
MQQVHRLGAFLGTKETMNRTESHRSCQSLISQCGQSRRKAGNSFSQPNVEIFFIENNCNAEPGNGRRVSVLEH